MANWCSNVVWFEADETTMQKIKEMFLRMAQQETETDCGQLPPFIADSGDWFFNIRWEAEDVLYYDTKWSPNTEVVRQIADYYKVRFTQDYEELGCLVFGRAIYANGVLTDTCLDSEDFEAYETDNETGYYLFEGETYESDYEIHETLLERKITNGI